MPISSRPGSGAQQPPEHDRSNSCDSSNCQGIDAQASVGVDFRSTIEWLQSCRKVGEWIRTTVYACCACRCGLAGMENAIRKGEEIKRMQCDGECRFESKGRFDEWSCGGRIA